MSVTERRLIRETSFGLTGKLWQISWLYVLLLCALAAAALCLVRALQGGAWRWWLAAGAFALAGVVPRGLALGDAIFFAVTTFLAAAFGALLAAAGFVAAFFAAGLRAAAAGFFTAFGAAARATFTSPLPRAAAGAAAVALGRAFGDGL